MADPNRCTCNGAEWCPLGRVGSELRCSLLDLRNAALSIGVTPSGNEDADSLRDRLVMENSRDGRDVIDWPNPDREHRRG